MAEINLDEIYEEWKARYPGEKISQIGRAHV